MRIETYIWTALCSIAYWNRGGLKTRFEIGARTFLDGPYTGGYAYTLGIRD